MSGLDAFVLAGGRSSRMGADKARLPWGGVPLAVATAASLAPVAERVVLVRRGAPDGLPWVGVDGRPLEVVVEPDDGPAHPLHGVATALRAARGELVLVVPCDVPGLSPESLRALVARAPAVASDGSRRHPLVGVFRTADAGRAEALARAGGRVHTFAEASPEVVLPDRELANLNRREDLPGPGPVATLLAGLPFLDDATAARVAEGERGRLAARGIVDP